MSPAARRRFAVGFESWAAYEAIVLANSEHEAIAKGKALYDLNGLAEFIVSNSTEKWYARELDGEALA